MFEGKLTDCFVLETVVFLNNGVQTV